MHAAETPYLTPEAYLGREARQPTKHEYGADETYALDSYRSLPTLEEYLIVSQDQQQVELYRRGGAIGWTHLVFEPGDALELASLGLSLALAALYEGTDVDG